MMASKQAETCCFINTQLINWLCFDLRCPSLHVNYTVISEEVARIEVQWHNS